MTAHSDLSGQRVLVTGAGSGIGAAIAQAVVGAGATVAVNDLDPARAEATCSAIGDRAVPVPGDVSAEEPAADVVARAVDALGGLTGLANNVGIVRGGPLADLSGEDWHTTFAVDLDSALWCSRAALPTLQAAGGAIVNTASLVAIAPAPGSGAYSAAKAALIAFSEQAALEWGPTGVRVNCVAPGLVGGTNFTPQSRNAELQERRGVAVPLRRTGTAADVAPVVVFLLSPAAGYVTGHTVVVDGGLRLAVQTLLPS